MQSNVNTPPESQNKVKKQRIVFIDIAKAVCIILVVIGHYFPGNSPGWYVTIHDIIYTFHMPLFMFASGYVYIATKKDIPYGQFILKKVRRLMVPYFVTSIIVISIKLLTQGGMSVDHPVTAMSYVHMLYLPEAGYFLWFIWALWWMFVLVPLFKTAKSRLILFLIGLVLHYVALPLPGEFCIEQFKNMLVFFMLGVVAFENGYLHSAVKTFRWRQTMIAILLFIILQSIKFGTGMHNGVTAVVNVLLPYVGIFFIIEVSKLWCHLYKVDVASKILMVAASSYIIYLFHTTFEGFTKAVFRKMPLDSGLWYIFLLEAIVVIAVGVIGPMVCFRIFKKYRVTKVLFGL